MIFLSAGHNPKQQGACNGSDYCEHAVATKWVEYIKTLIKPFVNVKIVPTGTLTEKVSYINSYPCKIAIEIHFNSNMPNVRGSECLYHPTSKKGLELAENILEEFEQVSIFQPNRGAKIGYYQMNPDNPIDYFLRKTNPVSVIIEPEFISQKESIEDNMESGCRAIADALIKFYHRHYKHD
jgi:N-acetylmuramoyl-L-alanine amidase